MFSHGPVACTRCWEEPEQKIQEVGSFRLVRDPGHWGAANPRFLVLGMSKGNTQSSAFQDSAFDEVGFKGIRKRMLEVFQAVGLLADEVADDFESRFKSAETEFAFASVVRCSLTGMDRKKGMHTADSPNVLPAFRLSSEGQQFVRNCVDQHIRQLPPRTETVLLLGNTDSYVRSLAAAINKYRGPVEWVNDMAYTSNGVLFVHLSHPSKGNGHFGAYIRGEGKPGAKRDMARAALNGAPASQLG